MYLLYVFPIGIKVVLVTKRYAETYFIYILSTLHHCSTNMKKIQNPDPLDNMKIRVHYTAKTQYRKFETSQKSNCTVSAPIPTFMFLWAIYSWAIYQSRVYTCIYPRLVCLFCCGEIGGPMWEYIDGSQTLECGNWDRGRAIPFLGTHKNFFAM